MIWNVVCKFKHFLLMMEGIIPNDVDEIMVGGWKDSYCDSGRLRRGIGGVIFRLVSIYIPLDGISSGALG